MKASLHAITAQETRVFSWLVGYNSKKEIAFLSRQISRMGDGPFYAVLGLLLFFIDQENGALFLGTGLVAYVIELPIYWVLKNSICRDRPCHKMEGINALIEPSDKFSFPSGHTAAAFVFAMMVMTFYPVFTVPVYIFATLVGLSRILLGVHYPSDILAGAVLGTVATYTAFILL